MKKRGNESFSMTRDDISAKTRPFTGATTPQLRERPGTSLDIRRPKLGNRQGTSSF